MFVPDIDHLNFTELADEKSIGRLREGVDMPLQAEDEDGNDVTDACFQILDRVIYTNRKMMPSMLTMDRRVIRQDCLCYLMERLSMPLAPDWKMPEQAAQ